MSTPDLLDHVPGAVWLPGVVGPASFLPTAPALTGRRPVVAHAPSSSWLKGSEWVDPVLQRMDKEGLLTYRRLQNLPPIMVPSLLREVDVVVDQVVLGNPGVLAAQASPWSGVRPDSTRLSPDVRPRPHRSKGWLMTI